MCFSPEADFAAAAVVGVVGVETLRRVRTRRELIVGLLPLLFAAHQLTEGFVWLGLRGEVASSVGDAAREAYVIYAHAVLPIIVPIGFFLIEPSRRHRRWLLPFVALGVTVGGYLLWQVTQYPIYAQAHAHCIAYSTHTPLGTPAAVAYVIAACGPALLSSRRYLQWFGVANLVGVAITAGLRDIDFTSVWCVYAALVSFLILEHFRRERQLDARLPRHRSPTATADAAGLA
jgi:hypothetical protein